MRKAMTSALILSVGLMMFTPLTTFAFQHGSGHNGHAGGSTPSHATTGTQGHALHQQETLSTSVDSSQNDVTVAGRDQGVSSLAAASGDSVSTQPTGNVENAHGTVVRSNHEANQSSPSTIGQSFTKSQKQVLVKSMGTISTIVNHLVVTNQKDAHLFFAGTTNHTVKVADHKDQTEAKALTQQEKRLQKDIVALKSLLTQTTGTSSNSAITTSAVSPSTVETALQKALQLAKPVAPTRSNQGGAQRGLARALSVLKANEARMSAESTALTKAIATIEALLANLTPSSSTSTTTVTGSTYGSDTSSSTTSATIAPTVSATS